MDLQQFSGSLWSSLLKSDIWKSQKHCQECHFFVWHSLWCQDQGGHLWHKSYYIMSRCFSALHWEKWSNVWLQPEELNWKQNISVASNIDTITVGLQSIASAHKKECNIIWVVCYKTYSHLSTKNKQTVSRNFFSHVSASLCVSVYVCVMLLVLL